MKNSVFRVFAPVFLCVFALSAPLFSAVSDRHKLRKSDAKPDLREQPPSKRQESAKYSEIISVDYDMRFGKILRINNKTAFVQIISKIAPAEIEPKFLVCNIMLEPVAELSPLHIGYKDCFAFTVIKGDPLPGDTVIVRYYKKELVPVQ